MLKTLFRSQAATQILDYLMDFPEIPLTKASIAKEAKVSWQTVNSYMPILLRYGILKRKNKKYEMEDFGKPNNWSQAVKSLYHLDAEISSKYHM